MAGGARLLPKWHPYFLLIFLLWIADIITIQGRKSMFALVFLVAGYGLGYEGYEDGKWKFGLYTPTVEYGYVMTDKEIYLDTVFVKK